MTISSERTPKVFVVQDNGKNYVPAMKYGRLEALLQRSEELSMVNMPTILRKLHVGLADMTIDDYLVLVGNPVSIGLACAIASKITGGKFNVLKWDAQESDYVPLYLNMEAS